MRFWPVFFGKIMVRIRNNFRKNMLLSENTNQIKDGPLRKSLFCHKHPAQLLHPPPVNT